MSLRTYKRLGANTWTRLGANTCTKIKREIKYDSSPLLENGGMTEKFSVLPSPNQCFFNTYQKTTPFREKKKELNYFRSRVRPFPFEHKSKRLERIQYEIGSSLQDLVSICGPASLTTVQQTTIRGYGGERSIRRKMTAGACYNEVRLVTFSRFETKGGTTVSTYEQYFC